jgi:cytochrome o ubiquinol oxidase operon protein cyoD
MIDQHHGWNVSLKPPILGFVFSLVLIAAAFHLVREYPLTPMIKMVIFGIAAVQMAFQLVFFLFIGMGSKPDWHTIGFLFTVLTAIFIIAGTIWIMYNLDYNMMPMEH